MWFFHWWRFAFAHGLNPFFTDLVWAPLGINLTWTTCQPLLSILIDPTATHARRARNLQHRRCCSRFHSQLLTFLLCHRVTGAFWPSVAWRLPLRLFSLHAGSGAEATLHLVFVFPVPLMALLTLRRLDAAISARRFTILLAALLTILFLSFARTLRDSHYRVRLLR